MSKGHHGAIKTVYALILAVIITGAIVGVATWYFTRPAKANVLEIYHWWTSGGEKAAITALVGVYESKYPDVGVIQSPVSGGAGYVMKALMKSLVLAGEAPDAFQLHAGYEMKPYVDGGYLDPINDLWSGQGWETVFPTVVKDMVKFGGNYYAVPVNIHRVNVVWYNKAVLDAHGISANITTWDAFFAACDKLVAEGMPKPIALGDQGKWAATHVLEQIIASEGIGFYQDFINGKVTSATNTTLRDALTKFSKYLSYVNDNHAALTWDGATALVINGKAAFNIMGDWANGEFLVANKVYGVDYGTFAVPGTEKMYGLCIDCFEHPKGVKHPENSLNWLQVVGSKEGQDAFNPLKGSISARTDADTTKYGPYQQAAIADFKKVTYMYPSVVHGSGMPEAFTAKLDDIMSAFVDNKDVSAAATSLTKAVTDASADFTKVWTLH
ncbi:ABC transporter substrate-binding protein [Candidatus Bathyarchaeota archaeon CG07_land_8_20_14_0_80_47_9]|nr:MAG: ABC transporter substrate-binding protein [Candidatus Bathyarchaeota archaeon CG07_land_8_20_14_0_80_47_9]